MLVSRTELPQALSAYWEAAEIVTVLELWRMREHALHEWLLCWRHVATLLHHNCCHMVQVSHTMSTSMIYYEYTKQ